MVETSGRIELVLVGRFPSTKMRISYSVFQGHLGNDKIRVLPSRNLTQTLDLKKLRYGTSIVAMCC